MKRFFTQVTVLAVMLMVVIGGAAAQSGEPPLDTLLVHADELYEQYEEERALDMYRKVLEREPDQYTGQWRTSFLYSRIGNRLESDDQKKEYFDKARMHAEQALRMKPDDVNSNYVMAVAMGRKALISGARERVAASRDIKKYSENALQSDSTHAGSWHVLGRWHLKVANLNFVERMAANALFGGLPEGASEEKAVRYLRKATELQPDNILYHFDLARALDETGREQQAIEVLGKALTLKPLTPDDPRLLKDCREMLDDLQ